MLATILLVVAAAQVDAIAGERLMRLELLGRAVSASFYAVDRFRCRGTSLRRARSLADDALGRDFQQRLNAAAESMTRSYGVDAVEQRTILIPIGHKLTRRYCREAMGLVDVARRDLAALEARLRNDATQEQTV